MKKLSVIIYMFLLASFTVYAKASKYDILINAANFRFSPDLRQITLDSPTLNLKNETSNTHCRNLSVNDFIKLWNYSPQNKKNFAASPPNAILTCWNKEKNYLEASFIIKKPSLKENKLVLNVEYLERNKNSNILPLKINAQPATKKDLQKYYGFSTQGASAIIIVDNPDNPWDPHGGRH